MRISVWLLVARLYVPHDRIDKEIEIIHELAQSVLEYEELLTTASDICGELDRFADIYPVALLLTSSAQSSSTYPGCEGPQARQTTYDRGEHYKD